MPICAQTRSLILDRLSFILDILREIYFQKSISGFLFLLIFVPVVWRCRELFFFGFYNVCSTRCFSMCFVRSFFDIKATSCDKKLLGYAASGSSSGQFWFWPVQAHTSSSSNQFRFRLVRFERFQYDSQLSWNRSFFAGFQVVVLFSIYLWVSGDD